MIRPAENSDAAVIADLKREIVEHPDFTFTTVIPTMSDVIDELDAARALGTPHFVAELDDKVVGFATWKQFRGGPGYRFSVENTVHLTEAARGSGLGTKLMSALLAEARKKNIHRVVAGISNRNSGGLAFHKKIGFVEVGRMPEIGNKYGEWYDLVLMQVDPADDRAIGTV